MQTSSFLPLRALSITLQFTQSSRFPFFHQPIITAWLRHLVGKTPHYEHYISIDTPESGCIHYPKHSRYCFSLVIFPGGDELQDKIIQQLQTLPHSVKKRDKKLAIRDNVILHSIEPLYHYTENDLEEDINLWQYTPSLIIRTLSPLRILLPKTEREQKQLQNESRYCRFAQTVDFDHLQKRLYDTYNDILRREKQPSMPYTEDNAELQYRQLSWLKLHYSNEHQAQKPMGGLLGLIQLDCRRFSTEQWRNWILGQYIGIGQRRVFGWGRYRLETPEGQYKLPRSETASSLLSRAATLENLKQACQSAPDVQRLKSLSNKLQQHNYKVPELQGILLAKADKQSQALAIPPPDDRIAQRAAAKTLGAAFDALMRQSEPHYRQHRSRHSAKKAVQEYYQKGYRWVYQAEIADIFGSLQWGVIDTQLRALFGDEPLNHFVMRWLTAPVRYQRRSVYRQQGLPEGSPLSPLIANIILDAFDRELDTKGFKLVRYAADVVLLCKNKQQAITAGDVAANALRQIGLELNQDKSRICCFADGFHCFGYVFVNELVIDSEGF